VLNNWILYWVIFDLSEKADMDIQNAILQAKKAAGENDTAIAQKILKKVISQEPKNVEAWLTLADIVKKPEVAEKCLQRVLQIDPGNQAAEHKLEKFQSTNSDSQFRNQEIGSAPHSLDERLQSLAQPSLEVNDPWETTTQTATVPASTASAAAIPLDAKPEIRPANKLQKKPKRSGRWLEFSLIGVLFVMAVCVLGLFLFLPKNATGQAEEPAGDASSPPDDPIAVIIDNIRASNAESIPHYMATIHSKSPSYQSTKKMTEQAFGLFDLSYKISGVKIVKHNKNEAVVAFTLTTQKIRGPSFRDNRITGDMILRKEDGKWKIYNQVVHDIKYLN